MRRLNLFVPLIIFIVLAILLGLGLQKETDELPSALIDKPLPNFSLPSLENAEKLLNQESFRGKPYLLNVWATWCPSCHAEHAYLLKLAKMGVSIVGINTKDEVEKANKMLEETGNPYIGNIVDAEGKLGLDLGVYGAPETFIVDADGIIRYRWVGVVSEEVWTQKLAPVYFNL